MRAIFCQPCNASQITFPGNGVTNRLNIAFERTNNRSPIHRYYSPLLSSFRYSQFPFTFALTRTKLANCEQHWREDEISSTSIVHESHFYSTRVAARAAILTSSASSPNAEACCCGGVHMQNHVVWPAQPASSEGRAIQRPFTHHPFLFSALPPTSSFSYLPSQPRPAIPAIVAVRIRALLRGSLVAENDNPIDSFLELKIGPSIDRFISDTKLVEEKEKRRGCRVYR